MLGVGLLPTLSSRISSKEMITQNFEKAIEDPAWRVRYMLADRVVGLQKSLGSSISDERLLPVFVRLLNDSEAEVRNCAASKVRRTHAARVPPPFAHCPACVATK
jgi:serine/threonine-protein phosphatase 2A regulatory subunit A